MNEPHESTEPPLPDAPPSEQPRSSLMGRFANVIAAPGEAFADIQSRPTRHANWILPLVTACILGIVYVVVMFSQPQTIQQLLDQQEASFQKQVDAGTLSESGKEKAMEKTAQLMKPENMMVMGSFGAFMVNVIMFFGVSLEIFLLSLVVFKPKIEFLKAMEAVGLATVISIPGGLISMLLMVITGKMNATVGPVLFISEFDPTSPLHSVLASINLFSIWYFALVALGLARLTSHSFAKSAAWIFSIWIVLKATALLLGQAVSMLTS